MATAFWSPGEQGALNCAAEEEAEEKAQREEARRKVEQATRDRLNEFLPKADPDSLKLASKEFLERMKKKVGTNVTGLAVVSEGGRMFLPSRRFKLAHPIVQMIFTQKLGVSVGNARQDYTLLEHVTHPRSLMPYHSIPRVEMQEGDVVSVKVDTTLGDESYISETECVRLRSQHAIHENSIKYLRSLARAHVEGNKEGVQGIASFDWAVIRDSQMPAILALKIVKLESDCRCAAVRVQLPPGASEFFAEQAFIHLIKHMVIKMFGDADKGTRFEELDDKYSWVYVYALQSQSMGDGTHEVLLMVGKRENPPETAARLQKVYARKFVEEEKCRATVDATMSQIIPKKEEDVEKKDDNSI